MSSDFDSLEDLLAMTPLPMMGRKSPHGRKNKYKVNCKRGHPLRGENLVIRKSGKRTTRTCKMCHDASRARWKVKNPNYVPLKRVAKQTKLERIKELENALLEVLTYVDDAKLKEHFEKIARGVK